VPPEARLPTILCVSLFLVHTGPYPAAYQPLSLCLSLSYFSANTLNSVLFNQNTMTTVTSISDIGNEYHIRSRPPILPNRKASGSSSISCLEKDKIRLGMPIPRAWNVLEPIIDGPITGNPKLMVLSASRPIDIKSGLSPNILTSGKLKSWINNQTKLLPAFFASRDWNNFISRRRNINYQINKTNLRYQDRRNATCRDALIRKGVIFPELNV
jgi:hypothetical protein